MKLTVGCLLYNDNNEILLAKRVKEPFAKTWTIPGGKVENNESIEECIIREIKEELNLEIQTLQFLAAGNEEGFKGHLFKGKAIGIPEAKQDEISEVKFFSISKIVNLDIGFNHKRLILDNWNK